MDEDILTMMKAGDQEGLKRLQERYGNLTRYVVRGVLGDGRDVEECVSDVFLRAWEKIGQYDPDKGRLSTWLTAVARNAALNKKKGIGAVSEPLEESCAAVPSPEEALLRQERVERLRSVIQALPRQEQILCYRKYYYMQSTAQIAAELGLTERAVEGRLYRLRQKLRKQLGGEAL